MTGSAYEQVSKWLATLFKPIQEAFITRYALCFTARRGILHETVELARRESLEVNRNVTKDM